MKYLALTVLSAPLSFWIFFTSYPTILSLSTSISSKVLAVLLTALTIKTNVSLIRSHLFERRAGAQGCGTVPTIPHKDPVLGLDTFYHTLRALKAFRLMEYYAERFVIYGNTHYTLALGQKMLITSERDNIKTILANKMEDWPIAGPRLYAALPVLGPRSIFTSNGPIWHDARAMIRPSFVRDQVADLQYFDKHIQNFLAAIPRDGTTFDIQGLLLKMTMDSSTDFMLGYSTNSLVKASPDATQFLEDFEYASAESTRRARLGPILYHLPHRKLSVAIARLRAYVRFSMGRAIEKKTKTSGSDRSYVFLDELLKANAPEEHVVDQILSIIVAGRDTTAAAAASVFYCLARDPESVRKLRKEIADLGVESPTLEELRQLKFLNNVVREALRLFPPISTNSRQSNKETVLPRGGGPDGTKPILVPAGMPVRWSLYSLHRNKDVYGQDAEEFRPERWEDLRVGWDYIPFHGGPRICLGQQFALSQMSYLLYKFFRVFEGIEAREEGPPLLRASITFSFAHGCLVAVKP